MLLIRIYFKQFELLKTICFNKSVDISASGQNQKNTKTTWTSLKVGDIKISLFFQFLASELRYRHFLFNTTNLALKYFLPFHLKWSWAKMNSVNDLNQIAESQWKISSSSQRINHEIMLKMVVKISNQELRFLLPVLKFQIFFHKSFWF